MKLLKENTFRVLALMIAGRFKYKVCIHEVHGDLHHVTLTKGAIVSDKKGNVYLVVQKGRMKAYYPGDSWLVGNTIHYLKDANGILHPLRPVFKNQKWELLDVVESEFLDAKKRDKIKNIELPEVSLLMLPKPEWIKWYAAQIREGLTKFKHESLLSKYAPVIANAALIIGVAIAMYIIMTGAKDFASQINQAVKAAKDVAEVFKAMKPPG